MHGGFFINCKARIFERNTIMKKELLTISVVSALAVTACKNKKGDFIEEPAVVEYVDTTATDNTEVAVPEPAVSTPADGDIITVNGKVTEIIMGKDGYTARLYLPTGEQYSATISIPNMANPKEYRKVKEGDDITITGEVTHIENDVLIKVTSLK